MTVLLTLTTAGSDSGPFDLYSNLDGYITAFETGVDKATLDAGYSTTVPDGASVVRITCTGNCINSVYITLRLAECDLDGYVEEITTTTTTSTTTICVPQTIYAGEKYNVLMQNSPSLFFNTDGTQIYLVRHNTGVGSGSGYDPIIMYTLGTAWDVSTIVANGYQTSTSGTYAIPAGVSIPTVTISSQRTSNEYFSPDGLQVFTTNNTTGLIQRYDLSTAWDITTLTINSSTLEYISTVGTGIEAIEFSPDGLTMILLGTTTARYDLITPWDIVGGTLISTMTGNSYDINFQNGGLYLFTFSGANLIRKTLGSPYDITTVTNTQTLNFNGNITINSFPRITFKDGFKGYINSYDGNAPHTVSAFELTCPFDISGILPAPTTTTTTTTSAPTTTSTTTVACECFQIQANISQLDLDDATGNTNVGNNNAN